MRQKLRRAIILVSFLLFPVVMNYLSPYVIIDGAFKGIVSGSFIVFALMFLFSLFFGRAYCGWLCPAGGLQEACFNINNKKVGGGKLDWIKYIFIWLPWIGIIISGFIAAGGIKKVDFLHLTETGISVSEPSMYITYYFVILLVLLLSLICGKRAFCHYACWMAPFMVLGRKIRNISKWNSLSLSSDKTKCTNCKMCTKNCAMGLDVNTMVQTEKIENTECILCGQCVDTCPQKAIKYSIK